MPNNIYVIDDPLRQALITIISKAVHPGVPFEQVESIRSRLISMNPVSIIDPQNETHIVPDEDERECIHHQQENNDGCKSVNSDTPE